VGISEIVSRFQTSLNAFHKYFKTI